MDVVECAVALDVEASLVVASRLGGADAGRVGATARGWVGVCGHCDGDGRDSGGDDEELHVGMIASWWSSDK